MGGAVGLVAKNPRLAQKGSRWSTGVGFVDVHPRRVTTYTGPSVRGFCSEHDGRTTRGGIVNQHVNILYITPNQILRRHNKA